MKKLLSILLALCLLTTLLPVGALADDEPAVERVPDPVIPTERSDEGSFLAETGEEKHLARQPPTPPLWTSSPPASSEKTATI